MGVLYPADIVNGISGGFVAYSNNVKSNIPLKTAQNKN